MTTNSASTTIPLVTTNPIFVEDVPAVLPEPSRELFEKYSAIEPDRVNDHLLAVRKRLYEVFPYPCIGRWRFLLINILNSPAYPEVLQRLKDGDKMLDMGCCVGQAIRRLVFDGAPSENLYGADLRQEFIDLGYELFQDKGKLKATFLQADILDPNSNVMQLQGKFNIINAETFFHLFDLEGQLQVARALLKLLVGKPGDLILGMQLGRTTAVAMSPTSVNGAVYCHSPESWRDMWAKLGEETGSKWETDVKLVPLAHLNDWSDPDIGYLTFSMKRL